MPASRPRAVTNIPLVMPVLGLLSVIVGALYSCSSDSLYDPDKAGDVKLAQYEAAFVGKYGAIASNQNWGFGGATTRSSNPNSNQWKDFVEVPSSDDLTSEKINKIVELFKDPSKATVIESVNWSDFFVQQDRKSTRLNSSHNVISRMPSSA